MAANVAETETWKNLILIVVESLTSKVFDYPEKEIYMSCLSGMEKDPAALVVTKVVPQVLFGQSSDGQFMYNTGLLPLQDEALVLNYGDKDYPSLAKALGKESAEVIGESGSVWKHNVTTASYGFGSLYDNASSTAKRQRQGRYFKRHLMSAIHSERDSFIRQHADYARPLHGCKG